MLPILVREISIIALHRLKNALFVCVCMLLGGESVHGVYSTTIIEIQFHLFVLHIFFPFK